ncbi:GroES-like protein [Stereum hirsutum FP-91666 SS1]|uniref:GroES-like protein n=1 Tax=Stereum hirsutum (strain FP-91666) TaxID=721885 RepID=UPI0004409CFE|nr:GroES-like protein [Stereum hirsutum FP-91666 SS1]EIM91562.1 GroES-like protein [Stereum hirsutum FP-91666 SS1]
MSVPQTQTALLVASAGEPFTVSTRFVPKPGSGQVLVKVEAAALNPIDHLIQSRGMYIREWPAVAGSDGAGSVVSVGEGVEGGPVKVGDRVLFEGIFAANRGTFQQYALSDASRTVKIPANLSYDAAATFPLGFHTAALALYGTFQFEFGPGDRIWRGMGLEIPVGQGEGKYKDEPILITGGSSSVGQYAIQLAKLSGFNPIITTASPSNTAYCTSAGATHVIDYHTVPYSALGEHISSTITTKPIRIISDVVSSAESQRACWDILSGHNGNGKMSITLPLAETIKGEMKENLVDGKEGGNKGIYSVFGNGNAPGLQEDGDKLAAALEGWLKEGKIKPNNVELLPGGLAAVAENVKRFHAGGVSAAKLVVRPFETVV